MNPTINAQCPSPAVQQPVAEPNAYLFKPLSQPVAETAIPEIITHPVSVGRNVRRPADIQIRDITYVVHAIKQGFYEGYNLKKAIEVIRNMSDKEAQRNAKSTLPWFSPSLFDGKRANENFLRARFMVFDIDHVGQAQESFSPFQSTQNPQSMRREGLMATPNTNLPHESLLPSENGDKAKPVEAAMTPDSPIESLKSLAIAKLPYLHYAFRSVNDGVKLIAQFTQDITNERDYCKIYVFLAMQIEWALKRICDNTYDPARACFLSYDPALLVNPRVKPLDPRVTLKQAEEVMKLSFPKGTPLSGSPASAGRLAQDSSGAAACRINSANLPDKSGDPGCKPQDEASTSRPLDLSTSQPPDDYTKAEKVIAVLSQIPIVYSDWIKLGQALYAGFGESGKPLWDMFLNNPNYSDTQRILDTHWRSFRNVKSIKLGSLFYVADKYGVRYE